VAAMQADLWQALVDVLAKYRNQPNSTMIAITALINFQRSIEGELIALEKDSRVEAGLPMFDKPESDDRFMPAVARAPVEAPVDDDDDEAGGLAAQADQDAAGMVAAELWQTLSVTLAKFQGQVEPRNVVNALVLLGDSVNDAITAMLKAGCR